MRQRRDPVWELTDLSAPQRQICSPSFVYMMDQRLRRWAIIET